MKSIIPLVFAVILYAVPLYADESFGKLHILLAGDTASESIGLSVEHDLRALVEIFKNGIPEERRTITVLTEESATAKNIESYFADLDCGAEDALLFYFAGHARIDREDAATLTDENHYFRLSESRPSEEDLHRRNVIQWMQKKKPRLAVVWSDSCAVFRKPFEPFGLEPFAEETKDYSSIDRRGFFELFFRSEGIVDINSSGPNLHAICDDRGGGVFTKMLTSFLRNPPRQNLPASDLIPETRKPIQWNDFFRYLQERQIEETGTLLQNGSREFMEHWKIATEPCFLQPASAVQSKPMEDERSSEERRLGFRSRFVASSHVLVETVLPGSFAGWNGLKDGDRIVAVLDGHFDQTDFADFSLEECLISSRPHPNAVNWTRGCATVHVRRDGVTELFELPISTTKTPPTESFDEDEKPPYRPLRAEKRNPDYRVGTSSMDRNGENAFIHFVSPFMDVEKRAELVSATGEHRIGFSNEFFERFDPNQFLMSDDGRFCVTSNRAGRPWVLFHRGVQDEKIWHETVFEDMTEQSVPLAFSADSKLLALKMSDKTLGIVDLDGHKEPGMETVLRRNLRIIPLDSSPRHVSFALRQNRLFVIDGKEVSLWNIATKERLLRLEGDFATGAIHPEAENFITVGLSPDAGLNMVLWSIQEDRALAERTFDVSSCYRMDESKMFVPFSVAYGPSGKRFLTHAWRNTILWNPDEIRPLRRLSGVSPFASLADFAFDGNRLWVPGNGIAGSVALWDIDSGKQLQHWGNKAIKAVRCREREKEIVVLETNGTIRLIDGILNRFFEKDR